jgi:tyrosyl-tRNA synthetase
MTQQFSTLLSKGVSRIIDQKHLESRLERGDVLRVKFGIDPTGTIVHLGHMVPILKLRAFQDLGHQVVLIIGDSTAQVGDTSDKEGERPMLVRAQTRENASNWLNLFGKVLDISKTEVRYNSEWMDSTDFNAVGELAKNFSVAEMLDRDNFSKRYKAGIRISLQEFLYPLMQGWDSVQVRADVEIGGNDQYFNLLAGRTLQEAHGQEKQDIMTFEILIGADGKKMAKTGGNCIAVDMPPNDMFVRLMEIKDELILDFFRLATLRNDDEVAEVAKRLDAGEHPKNVKLELARTVVSMYHGSDAAAEAQTYFEKVLTVGAMPSEEEMAKAYLESGITIVQAVKELGYFATTGDARNGVTGGGVRIDGEVVSDIGHSVALSPAKGTVIQAGKKKFAMVYAK